MKVTLIVATLNRSDFMVRLLRYYYDNHFTGCILIGDSSNEDHAKRLKIVIGRLSDRLNIRYVDCPGLGSTATYAKLASMVDTPCVTLLGDDDFITVSGLEQCVQFLDCHSEYVAANGRALVFRIGNGLVYGKMNISNLYPSVEVKKETAARRLLEYLRHYTVSLFSVHRSDAWRLMWKDLAQVEDRAFGSELLPCCLSIVLGKVAQLDCLYLLRQTHDQRYLPSRMYDWITSEEWYPSYAFFRERLAETLVQLDGISLDEARSVVKQGFCSYLSRCSREQWETAVGSGRWWRELARSIPGAQGIWRLLQSRRLNGYTVSALLDSSSPYHSDFIPVHRIITTPPSISNP